MVVNSEPFKKEEAVTRFDAILEFTNWYTNEALEGKFWVIWKLQDVFDVVGMID